MKSDLIQQAIKAWGLAKITEEEKRAWGYRHEINYSYNFVLNKEVVYLGKRYVVKNIFFDKYKRMNLMLDSGKTIKPTAAILNVVNPFSNSNTSFNLNPARQFGQLLKDGYLLDKIYFKEVYYKTDEYRSKYESGLEKSTHIKGIKAPIQDPTIKKRITDTMHTNYGVDWFLNRGEHYNKITRNIYKKFKHDPVKLFKILGVSWLEIDIISELIRSIEFSDDVYYFAEDKDQFCFEITAGQYKFVDFYDKVNNLIIEVNGDFWHANPSIFAPDSFNQFANSTANEIWEEEARVNSAIVNKFGCTIFIIWESEWKQDKQNVIRQIKKDIMQRIVNIKKTIGQRIVGGSLPD